MTQSLVASPFQPFVGLTGAGLNNGSLYIGIAGLDPQTNPQAVYWDAAGTIPASQPLQIQGGYPMRLGTPAQFYTAASCSMRLRDSAGSLVFYVPTVSNALATLGTASTYDVGTSGAKVPLLNGANTWSASQAFGVAPTFTDASGTRANLGLGTAAQATLGLTGATVPLLTGNSTFSGIVTFAGGSGAGAASIPMAVQNDAVFSAGQTVDFAVRPTNLIDMRMSGKAIDANNGTLQFSVFQAAATVSAVSFASDRSVTFHGYGAGTLVTSSSGVISATSDGRLKDVVRPYVRGLADLRRVGAPVVFAWKSERKAIAEATARLSASEAAVTAAQSALQEAKALMAEAQPGDAALDALHRAKSQLAASTDQLAEDRRLSGLGDPEYAGWIAQDLQAGLPEAVSTGVDGFLTVNDRAVIAALFNAVMELSARVEALEGRA